MCGYGVRKCALVTGASSGLGRAVALQLAADGWCVVLVGRDKERLAEVADKATLLGGMPTVAQADVRDRFAIRQAVVGHSFDLVVHAAGILKLDPTGEEIDVRDCVETNILGTVNVVEEVISRIVGRGHLAIVSSVVALATFPGPFSLYASTKWAVRGYGEAIRQRLRAMGATLTMVYPSLIDTPMLQGVKGKVKIYDCFCWHSAAAVAKVLLRDSLAGRRESFATAGDRILAFIARRFPRLFSAGVAAWVDWRSRGLGVS